MKGKISAAMMVLWATHAAAQTNTPAPDDEKQVVAAPDPGRQTPDDREGLSGRGGSDPAGSGKTYSATIGTPIYTAIGTPIGRAISNRTQR